MLLTQSWCPAEVADIDCFPRYVQFYFSKIMMIFFETRARTPKFCNVFLCNGLMLLALVCRQVPVSARQTWITPTTFRRQEFDLWWPGQMEHSRGSRCRRKLGLRAISLHRLTSSITFSTYLLLARVHVSVRHGRKQRR